uniref:Uncharacterized protein n=1 Tax=Gopherus evgoodei TaxID=1825980 RepID=A0A8C4Y5I0_9SAUR
MDRSPLHIAAERGHTNIADVLLWHKAFVNAKTKLGLTPLHLSAQNGYNHLVKLLLLMLTITDSLFTLSSAPLFGLFRCVMPCA